MNREIQQEDINGTLWTWPTKTAYTAAEKALRARAKLHAKLTGQDEAIALYALRCHPRWADKLGEDYAGLTVVENHEHGSTTRGFAVLQGNGTYEEYSLEFYKMSEDKRQRAAIDEVEKHAQRAARWAIEPSIKAARRRMAGSKTHVTCAECKQLVSVFDTHVHHAVVKFRDIWKAFRKHGGMSLPRLLNRPGGIKEFADKNFTATWIAFHDKEATLQLVCSKCNYMAERGGNHHTKDEKRTGFNLDMATKENNG